MLIPWVFILYQNKKKQGRSLLKLCKLRSQSEIHDMSICIFLKSFEVTCLDKKKRAKMQWSNRPLQGWQGHHVVVMIVECFDSAAEDTHPPQALQGQVTNIQGVL